MMSFFEDLLKGTRFERSYENLTQSADKAEDFAEQVEQATVFVVDLVEQLEVRVAEFVNNLRESAASLRAEADTKTEGVYDSVRPQVNVEGALSPEEKKRRLEFIKSRLASAGVTSGTKWLDPVFTASVPDTVINYTYKVFGGK